MDRLTKYKIIIASDFILLGLVVWGYIAFINIYRNGMATVVYINRYGEANLELVVIPLLIGFHVLGFYYLWKFYLEEKKEKSDL